MATEVAAPAPAPASPKPKKGKGAKAKTGGKSKATSSHPAYGDMIRKAITTLNDKKGSSKAAILKYLMSNYKLGESNLLKVGFLAFKSMPFVG